MLYHKKHRGVEVLLALFILLVEDVFARIFMSFNHGSDSGRKQAGWTLTRDVIVSQIGRHQARRTDLPAYSVHGLCRPPPMLLYGRSESETDAAVRNPHRYRKSTAGRYPSAQWTSGANTVRPERRGAVNAES